MQQMITPDEARAIILSRTGVLPAQTIAHAEALHRVLAEDVTSPLDLPPFDNSAMDGFAVVADDLKNASQSAPQTLRLLETIGAGEVASQKVESGACTKIMTGAKVPEGADAVVMREETEEAKGAVQFFASAKARQNIRPRGDDVKIGERVLPSQTFVRAAEWAMLASLGKSQVEVFRAPRVGIITTGEELVDVDAELSPGQIRDSNSFALEGLCREIGASVEKTRVGDDVSVLRKTLGEYSRRCDCIVTSGGVSAGDFDPVRDALFAMQDSGEAEIHFWKIAMKPGKPVMYASLNGEHRTSNVQRPTSNNDFATPTFGLPGNPVSVMVAFEQFVRPALLKMQGRKDTRICVRAQLLSPIKSPRGKVEFVRARAFQENEIWHADVTGDQSSGRLSTMTRANALLTVPAETTRLEAGEAVAAQLLD
jgi:molybdopterin molybdotransferase